MMKRLLSGCCRGLIAALLLAPWPVVAGEALAAVASNFTATMNRLVAGFERHSGHRITVSYGSSGKLYTQIIHGAPFHLLLSADAERPEQLEREGHAVAGSRYTYALGQLALWSREAGVVDAGGHVLRSGNFQRLAIANPKTAPYGAAAMEVLQALGLQAALMPRLVYGDNIAQTHQFVATGNAQLGFVALAQAQGAAGSWWQVPQQYYTPLRQQAVLLRRGADNAAAQALLHFLRSDEARRIISESGYGVE